MFDAKRSRVFVQKVVMPATGAESWTLVGDDCEPVEPAEAYLAYLCAIERSPTTVRAYAFSLKLWFEFLSIRGLAWDRVDVDSVAQFVAWLRSPADNIIVLDAASAVRAPATVNRHLAAVFGLYDYQARSGVTVAVELVAWRRVGRGSYKPFLHHVTKGRPIPTRPVKLAVPRQVPRTLTDEQILAVLFACDRLRDRFLFALLAETGMRIGQALGLRHSDFVSRDRQVRIVPRVDNANGARAKTRSVHVIPVTAALVRLYSEYLHTEYGDLDSDYVFVNLWSDPRGQALRYSAVADLVARIRAHTGIFFTLHMLRHSRATDLIRRGVPIEVTSKLLTHRSVSTTSDAYVHLGAEDVRAELVGRGVWQPEEPR
jgi:integrase